jgi:hypothetical protein
MGSSLQERPDRRAVKRKKERKMRRGSGRLQV